MKGFQLSGELTQLLRTQAKIPLRTAFQVLSIFAIIHLVYLTGAHLTAVNSPGHLDDVRAQDAEWSALMGTPLRIGILTSYPPQLSDVGEYTRDLFYLGILDNVDPLLRRSSVGIVIVDDKNTADNYGPEVSFLFRKEVHKDYLLAAEFINREYDVLSLQHDFDVYGGYYGELLLVLLDHLTIPYVVNIHSLPAAAEVHKLMVLEKVLASASHVTAPLPFACGNLTEISPPNLKCSLLPQGFLSKNFVGKPANISFPQVEDDRRVILSPLLASPIRGLERMVEGMKGVRVLIPKTMYVILGAQEPGQTLDYIEHLRKLAKRAGVGKVTTVVPEQQSFEQLVRWYQRAEVIVDPSDDPNKMHSRALSMAISLGVPAVASAFPYAEHICGAINKTSVKTHIKGPCTVVPINNPRMLAMSVIGILRNATLRNMIVNTPVKDAQTWLWPRVAKEWSSTLARIARNRTEYMPQAKKARHNFWPLWPAGDAYRQAALSAYGTEHKGRGATIRGQLMVENVAREVLFGKTSADRRLAADALQNFAFGPLIFSSYIPRDPGCEIIGGVSGMQYTHNGIGAFHRYAMGDVQVLTHSLPTKELILGWGVRYGGMYVNLVYKEEEIRTRIDDSNWSFLCKGDAARYAINMIINSTQYRESVASVELTFDLLPGGSVVALGVKLEPLKSACLERVEVIVGADSMSSWFPGLIFNQFQLVREGSEEIEVIQSSAKEAALYQRGSGLPRWSLLTNSAGDFGVVTVFENQSQLAAIRSDPDAKSNFHYVRSEYFLESVCQTAHFKEQKILLARVDMANVRALNEVVKDMTTFYGVDISGPSNRALVQDAFEELAYHKQTDMGLPFFTLE